MPLPSPSAFTSPLPAPPASAPTLGLTVWAEPVGVAPGETVTLTLRLEDPGGALRTGLWIRVTLPDPLHVVPGQPDWVYDAQAKQLHAELRTLEAGAGLTRTLVLRAAGPVDAYAPVALEAVSGDLRATATAEIWIVQPGRARVAPESGGLLVSPDRRAWARFPPGTVEEPAEVAWEETKELPAFLPYSLGRGFAVRGIAPSALGVRISRKELPADPVSWQLVALFRYEEAAKRWERLPTTRRWEGEDLVLTAKAEEEGTFAVALSTQSDIGNYAQPWQPTVRDFQVDLFTGAVVWEIPIEVPPGRNGQKPALVLRYHSGVVDELRGTQNPQGSWVGLGWSLDPGYIIRKIDPDPNGVPRCTDEYYLVLNGVSSRLIPIGNNEYRTEDERHWRVRRLTTHTNRGGDYWLVTTPDGTQYRFGYTDETADLPGYGSDLSAWWMVSAGCDNDPDLDAINWRWNLDHVVDPHHNIIRIQWVAEHNNFCFVWDNQWYCYADSNPCSGPSCHIVIPKGYVRGGYIDQITYSWPNAAHRIRFVVADRGDYPWQFDSQTAGIQFVQTFWSKKHLQAIEVYSDGQGRLVRRYVLAASIQNGFLVLNGIQEIAADGTRLPATAFGYHWLAGYSGSCEPGRDEGAWKPWLGSLSTGYGGSIGFDYIQWPGFQNGQILGPNEEGKCWYRYRVREATANPGVGPVMRTVYEYRNAADDGPHSGSWQGTEFRGHPRVRVIRRNADGSVAAYTDHYFHQGLGQSTATGICGGDVADVNGLQGREYKRVDYDGAGNVLMVRTTRWQLTDLGGGRRFVAPAAVCEHPNDGNGPYRRTDYAYDDYGNITRIVQSGDATRPGDEATVERAYVYNTTAWIVDRLATESLRAGDGSLLRQTRIAYDGQPWGAAPTRGSPTAVMRGLDGWGWVTTTTQYDDRGNPIATADPLGRVTRTSYDPAYQQYPTSTTNPLTQTTRIQWDLRLSVPVVITDANGAATRYTYDPFGRLTGVIYPGESVPAVRYAYPTGDALSAPWVITAEVRVDPYNPTPTYQRSWTFYDGLGRPIQTQTQAENGGLVVQDTAYDALGRPVIVTLPYTVTASGGTYIPPDWSRPKTATRYDALGRVVEEIAPDGSVTRRAYRDWRELVLDAEGHQTEYERDGLGRLIAVREYYGTYSAPTWNPAETPAETRYWYDAAGNLIGVRDALGNVTRIAYDPLGRKTAMDDPSMGRWEYRYDAAGNLVKQRDARHQAICFYYDPLNRLVGKTYHANVADPDGLVCPGPPYAVAYGYDQGPNGVGRRTAMTDTTGVTTWRYDARGRVLTETRTLTSIGTFTTGWGYDAAGRVVRQVYPDGEVVTTAYNLRGLPTAVVGQSPYLTGATYNALGRPLQQNWGNGRVTAYAYHLQSARLTQLTVSGNLLDLRYGYDRVGNITAITDTVNGGQVQTFGYDARDRLVWARTNAAGNGQYSETYGYDRMGNILTRTVGSQTVAYAYGCPPVIVPTLPSTLPHRVWLPLVMKGYGPDSPPPPACTAPFAVVRTSAGFRAEYDPNGNMVLRVEVSGTQRITYTQEYNAENRLAVVTNTVTGQVTRFVYDGDGNRVLRIGPEGTTVYIGDYYEQTGSTVRKYYYAAGQRMAMRVGGALYFLHSDHLGSATVATDSGGNRVGEVRYRPYGERRPGYSLGAMVTDRLYTGQRWEGALGLYDYRARFYDPALGRFLQPDSLVQTDGKDPTPYLPLAVSYANPKVLEQWNQLQRARLPREAQAPNTPSAFDPQFLNRYAYARHNPLAYVDDSGHIAWWVVGGVVGGVVGLGVYVFTHRESFDWREAALWTAGGAVVGATLGAGAQWAVGAWGTRVAMTAGAATSATGMALRSPAGARTILWLEEEFTRVEHIMAPKHAWDRLINLSGNALQDYRAIQPFLQQIIESGSKPEVIGMTRQGQRILQFVGKIKGETVVVRVIELSENLYQISNAFVKTLP